MGLFDFLKKKKPSLLEDIKTASNWISTALNSSGYKADFTMESLKEIDRFFSENSDKGEPSDLLLPRTGQKIFAIGAYIGEVIIKNGSGYWETDDSDPNGEVNICVNVKEQKIYPAQRAVKRLKNGEEDSIYAYGYAILK